MKLYHIMKYYDIIIHDIETTALYISPHTGHQQSLRAH
jgi:hypothetical protein